MDDITFCREIPNFCERSKLYYFVTFNIDESSQEREISNINIVIFSHLDYEGTIEIINDESNKEKFNIYVKSLLEKLNIPFRQAKWTAQYVGMCPGSKFKCKKINYINV